MIAPVAKQTPHELRAHEQVRVDNYYWMRDDDRKDPEVLAYLEAENAYAGQQMQHLSGGLENQLFDEIVARIKQDDASVPYRLNGYWYYTRYEHGREYPLYCRKHGSLEAPEHVMLDGNEQAKGRDYYQAGALAVSKDTKTLAYAEDTLGRRIYDVRFRDLNGSKTYGEALEGAAGAMAWALDNKTLFYVKRDPQTLRAHQVWRHVLGTPVQQDVLVYDEKDEEFHVSVWRTKSDRYLLIGSFQTTTHEMRYLAADKPTGAFEVFLPRIRGHEYEVTHANDRFYVRTNWQARDFRLMSARPGNTQEREAWREEVPARDGVFLSEFDVFAGHLALGERRGGVTRLRVVPWSDKGRIDETQAHEVAFEEPSFLVELGQNPEMKTDSLRFDYTSLTTPASVFDYDMRTRVRELKKRQEVLGGFRSADYASERLEATAADGTQVPISLVFRKDLDRTRPQPLLLYGYGAYGISMDPYFSSPRLSLLDRGFIFAIAHVRGGQEFGRRWYEDGKLLHKENTFADFNRCAEHLVAEGWTTTQQLYAMGGSAGGLLMGTVANKRPDLYKGIVASVPFVDVLTTMLDESIPLTTFEYEEWGNPNDKRYYDYIGGYSPYDNVKAQEYPNILVLSGLHDSQVQYWEPTKWVAKLRAVKRGDQKLLLHTNMEAGHSGASGRFRRHKETALIYSFLLGLSRPGSSLRD